MGDSLKNNSNLGVIKLGKLSHNSKSYLSVNFSQVTTTPVRGAFTTVEVNFGFSAFNP